MRRAKKEGVTISDVIEMALRGYVNADAWKQVATGKQVVPYSIVLNGEVSPQQ
jgi:hypothetical protein